MLYLAGTGAPSPVKHKVIVTLGEHKNVESSEGQSRKW